MKKVQREDWADFAKGIGIILVRFGHQKIFGKKLIYLIYAFHMPLFFMISGYFYKNDKGAIKQIKHKAYSILMPYFSYEMAKWIMVVLKGFIINKKLDFHMNFLLGLFLNIPESQYCNPIWFFSCLFSAEVVFIIINKIIFRYCTAEKQSRNVLICTLIISAVAYVWYLHIGVRLLWNLDLALIMLPFLGVGSWIKINGILKKICDLKYMTIYAMLLVAVCIVNASFGQTNIDYAMRNYNEWFSCILVGVIGTLFILTICIKIKENKLLRFIGKNSGLYYLMIGTVTKAWGKVYQCIIGTSKNEYIYFFFTLTLALITLVPICYILNRYFAFFIGKKRVQNV